MSSVARTCISPSADCAHANADTCSVTACALSFLTASMLLDARGDSWMSVGSTANDDAAAGAAATARASATAPASRRTRTPSEVDRGDDGITVAANVGVLSRRDSAVQHQV